MRGHQEVLRYHKFLTLTYSAHVQSPDLLKPETMSENNASHPAQQSDINRSVSGSLRAQQQRE